MEGRLHLKYIEDKTDKTLQSANIKWKDAYI